MDLAAREKYLKEALEAVRRDILAATPPQAGEDAMLHTLGLLVIQRLDYISWRLADVSEEVAGIRGELDALSTELEVDRKMRNSG